MGISDGLMQVVIVRVAGLSGEQGVGLSRLRFSLELDVQATRGRKVRVTDLRCFVWAGSTQGPGLAPLGAAHAETSWYSETGDHSRPEMLSLFLDLSGEQMLALERMRGGGGLAFRLDLHALVESAERGLQRGFQQLPLEANLSMWSKVLKELGQVDILLLGVELPLKNCPPPLRAAADKIREAHHDLIGGRTDAVVRNVRLAMDVMESVVPYETSRANIYETFANKRAREGMSRRARADLVRVAVRHYTHLSHHLDPSTGTPASFARHDATFILAAAAACLTDAIEAFQAAGTLDASSI